jgi:hypothetical protein
VINFRYHLVSIAAILIALAAGIALGSGPLDDASRASDDDAGNRVDPAVAKFETGFAARTASGLLKDKLKGQSVVVLTVPGADEAQVKSISSNLAAAGATVTGEIALTAKLLDSSGRQFAQGVAEQAAADVPAVASATNAYDKVGAAIARSLMANRAGDLDATAATIRSALVEGDLLDATKVPDRAATLAVLVTSASEAKGSDRGTVVAALAASLNRTGKGIVVAGPPQSSLEEGSVRAVRDSEAGAEISTVDVTDSGAGRIVTVLAAAAQAAGRPGAWGTSRSADGALPR